MTKDYSIFIADIVKAMDDILNFVRGMSYEDFRADDKTASAVVRKFEIIGEAAKNIPQKMRLKVPSVPWKEMAGMRDRLVHLYNDVDYRLVWETIRFRIPIVKQTLSQFLQKSV